MFNYKKNLFNIDENDVDITLQLEIIQLKTNFIVMNFKNI